MTCQASILMVNWCTAFNHAQKKNFVKERASVKELQPSSVFIFVKSCLI